MEQSESLKRTIRESYGAIAREEKESCCATSCCGSDSMIVMNDEYNGLAGYAPEADLGLGCGLPTQFAGIRKGDVVMDLGSGAGNDCFVARAETGETGRVIGIDMTEDMIKRARKNAEKLNYDNVEFRLGEIEDIPVANETADVLVSNCVLNLVPDKSKAFAEIFRVLKPGGHFSISDIVLSGELPESITSAAELYVGCVTGSIQKDQYLGLIADSGFENIRVQKETSIHLPDQLLLKYMTEQEAAKYRSTGAGVFSITVYAEKPGDDCCDKETCCK